ncbi:MAG TPA: hypothetical protein VFA59_02160 [Vicinamibacterales bacterium]|nr:hypothetical protein [Vicinamibacterales bacterium]
MLLAIPLLAAALGQDLPFDRPEAWAQQYFTTVSMLTGLGPATPERAGDVSIQLESGWIPSLSPSEERVGFSGTSAEDLNKAPVLFRPRVRVALPARFAVVVGGVPPVRAFGVTPRLVAAAVEWTMIDRRAWRASWRVHGQTGSVTGAFTCPDAVVGAPDGSTSNPTGGDARSSDVATLRYGAIEFEVARTLARFGGATPHVSIAVNGIDSRFQVNAQTFGQPDHTLLTTRGVTEAFAGGVAVPLGRRFEASLDAFYSPLFVRRSQTDARTVDGLFNVRGLISYRVNR